MNPPQVYMYSPSRTLLPPPSPYHPSGPSQCTSPKHPASCIEHGIQIFYYYPPSQKLFSSPRYKKVKDGSGATKAVIDRRIVKRLPE